MCRRKGLNIMNLAGFHRNARHLNYRRTFPTPVSARVDIPCLPYEAFTPDGRQIKPWSLIRFFESVRGFTFWPVAHAENPGGSLAEFNKVLKYNQFFIVGARVDIERRFHDSDCSKFPLTMKVELEHVGSSSKRISYRLHHADTDELFATCSADDVLMSVSTRQKTPYPDWWMAKYGRLCQGQKSDVLQFDDTVANNIKSCTHRRDVEISDTDAYGHANWSTHVKFAFDSIHKNIQKGEYTALSSSHVDSGIRTMQLVYKAEANLGDVIKIQTWDNMDADIGPVLYCDATIDGKSCFQLKSSFY